MNIADLEIGQIGIVDRVINARGKQGILQRPAAMGVERRHQLLKIL